MSRVSISNLAWPKMPVEEAAPQLVTAGMAGVELAPTAIWAEAPFIPAAQVRAHAKSWRDHGLAVSGIQSLLYGHPEMQIFDRYSWPSMYEHLTAMIRLAHDLGTNIAVFGSPKNRIRGELDDDTANELCAEFLTSLLPTLGDCGVVLALEPNAPAYGADYLTHYADTVNLSDLISSAWVQPQVDTGCLVMVGDSPDQAVHDRLPAHVHISTPNLMPPPGPIDHQALQHSLVTTHYDGWIVLEMLQATTQPFLTAIESAQWLAETYGPNNSCHGAD